MTFVKLPMDGSYEDENVPSGEYDLEVTAVNFKKSKNSGKPMHEVVIAVTNPPEEIESPAPIFHYLNHPVTADVAAEYGVEEDTENAIRMKMQGIQRFLIAFGIPFTAEGFDEDTLLGATGHSYVTLDEREDAPGQFSNNLKLPKVTKEQLAGAQGSRGGRRRARA